MLVLAVRVIMLLANHPHDGVLIYYLRTCQPLVQTYEDSRRVAMAASDEFRGWLRTVFAESEGVVHLVLDALT